MKVPQTPMHPITIINALESTWDKIEKKEADSKLIQKERLNFGIIIGLEELPQFYFSVFYLVGFITLPFFSSKSSPIYNKLINSGEGLVEQTNNSSKPQIITLSDGSSVLLQ
jgi:hypothetical protein